MSKIKFNLKSVCSITIKDANGKAYRLKQGTNTLELDTDDYLALTKALGLKPTLLRSKQHTPKQVAKPAVKTNDTQDTQSKQSAQVDNAPSLESDKVEETVESVSESSTESTDEAKEQEPTESVDEVKEQIYDTTNTDAAHTDYSTWSYNELKAEYKNITGNNCRLKKGEIIAFLQEHENV